MTATRSSSMFIRSRISVAARAMSLATSAMSISFTEVFLKERRASMISLSFAVSSRGPSLNSAPRRKSEMFESSMFRSKIFAESGFGDRFISLIFRSIYFWSSTISFFSTIIK